MPEFSQKKRRRLEVGAEDVDNSGRFIDWQFFGRTVLCFKFILIKREYALDGVGGTNAPVGGVGEVEKFSWKRQRSVFNYCG